ncbi:MAG: T9SS type A sorting domain-containing protein [Bacteroidetes bacterium]|nr:T9SS type A sorting domain-containing protein [Bacteroidota bacterium]
MKKYIIPYSFIFLLLFSNTASAVVKTFANNGNWNSSNSWSPSGVPTSADDVIIPTGKSPNVNINNGQCKSLTIQTGASLLIGNSKALTINNTSGLSIAGTLDINGGNITLVNTGTAFTIAAGGSVKWKPGTNTLAGATLFTKATENFAATSTLTIKKWYDLNVGLGSVITGNLGNLTIDGVSGTWQMKNTLQSCMVLGTLTLTSSYIVLDNTGAISNTTLGNISITNNTAYMDFFVGNHPGTFTVNTGNVTVNQGEMDCFYQPGTGNCIFNLNGSLSVIDQGMVLGTYMHNGNTTINISGDVNLTNSQFYGVFEGSGNSTVNITGNLNTIKSGSTYGEFYGIKNGNGTFALNVSGNFSNQGYCDLIWNSGLTGVGNGNCSLNVGGTFSQSDGDFRGIWNATTTNSGACSITLGSINFTGGIFMVTYSCAASTVAHSLTVTGNTTITFSNSSNIFRGNGISTLTGTNNNSACSISFNGATNISGNISAEFTANAGYGTETISFGSTATISGGNITFGSTPHNVTLTGTGAFTISGGTVHLSKSTGTSTLSFLNDFTISGGTTYLKNNTGKTSAQVDGNFSMSSGTFYLYGNNSVNNSDSTSLRTYGDFSHAGGTLHFSNYSSNSGTINLFINGTNYNLSGTGTMTSAGAGTSNTFGTILFGNTTNTNYNRTSTSHNLQQIKYRITSNGKVTAIAGPIQISSHATASLDFFSVEANGTFNSGTIPIVSNGLAANCGIKINSGGTLEVANPNGIYDGTDNAAIGATGNMNYSLDPNSTVIYRGVDNQKISGYGNGIATGAQHQYGNLTIDFGGTPDAEYVYLERNTSLRGVLRVENGELRLNSFTLTAESASGSGNGYVKSEDNLAVNTSRLKVGYSPSNKNLVFPFGRSSTEVIYLNLNITNNPGSGYITISTRKTATNNTPLPGTDNVNEITNINPGGQDVSISHVIDRWWEINAPGVTADYILRYSGDENTTSGSTATGTFNVQFWNGSNFTKFNSTGNGVTTGVGSISSNLTNINGPIVLSSGSASLPIKLLQFDAKVTGAAVEITWTTAEEKNNDFFSIERSEDGQTFEKIEEVDGAGNSNQILKYKTMDDAPLTGVSYYRLKQTDFDGKFTYSPLRAINRGAETISDDPAIEVNSFGPNPFSDQFNVEYKLAQAGETSIIIFNMSGQVVFETTKNDDLGNNSFIYTDDKNLPPANYILQIINGKEKVSKKIVKR